MNNRTVAAEINGQERLLNYSIDVMFEMGERYGNIPKALEVITQDDKEGFEAVRWFAVRMANDGELLRREEGLEKLPLLTDKDISSRIHPMEFLALREAVIKAITLGYRRDIKPKNEEVDLGLAELNSKKA